MDMVWTQSRYGHPKNWGKKKKKHNCCLWPLISCLISTPTTQNRQICTNWSSLTQLGIAPGSLVLLQAQIGADLFLPTDFMHKIGLQISLCRIVTTVGVFIFSLFIYFFEVLTFRGTKRKEVFHFWHWQFWLWSVGVLLWSKTRRT